MMHSIQAGFSRVDITPPPGMETYGLGYWYARSVRFRGVRDALFARALALGDGGSCQVIVSLDAILDTYGFIPDAQARIAGGLGLSEASVFIGCTHTHSAPLIGLNNVDRGSEYGPWVAERIVASAFEAFGQREPMSVVLSQGPLAGALYNRRPLLSNGRIAELHVPLNRDDIVDAGPVNETMTVLKFRRLSGELSGAICHFGIHGVAVQCSDLISSDCMGRAIQRAETAASGSAVILHLNGPCADIDPAVMGSDAALDKMTDRLFAGIRDVSAMEERPVRMTPQRSVSGSFQARRRETRSAEDLFRAERDMPIAADSSLQAHHSGSGYGRYLIEEERKVATMPETFDIPYQILRAGEMVWVGVGGEIFTCFGERLTSLVPSIEILPVGITGASKGYLPPKQAFSQGGYEVAAARWCPIAPGETEKLFAQIEEDVCTVAGGNGK